MSKYLSLSHLLVFLYFASKCFAVEWVARYDGGFTDRPCAITVDDICNIYVTGWSFGSGSAYDYATIKYDSAGNEQWVARYNGPNNTDDKAYAIVVDDMFNVYVSGRSYGNATGYDYATVKYNSSGVQQWVARYDGPMSGDDVANALVIDDFNNIYVTGGSSDTSTGFDYATVKYNSSGVQQWVARYDGPMSYDDVANALTVYNSHYIYVTGYSFVDYVSKYTTIKYDTSGNELWVAWYNEINSEGASAEDLVTDIVGNIYVVGTDTWAGTGTFTTLVKYDSLGVEKWTGSIGGLLYSNYPSDITIDEENYIYFIYTVGDPYHQMPSYMCATKDDTSGASIWTRGYGGPEYWYTTNATAIAADYNGNAYLTGASNNNPGTDYDFITIMYDSTDSGAQQWVARYNGPTDGKDISYAIVTDNAGNVYVTGESEGSVNNFDYATIKYNRNYGIHEHKNSNYQNISCLSITPSICLHEVTISVNILDTDTYSLYIINALGKIVRKLNATANKVVWDGCDDFGNRLSDGVYFIILKSKEYVEMRKVVLLH